MLFPTSLTAKSQAGGGSNIRRAPVFGVPLAALMEKQKPQHPDLNIPLLVKQLIHAILCTGFFLSSLTTTTTSSSSSEQLLISSVLCFLCFSIALEVEGIFRLAGSQEEINRILDLVERGEMVDFRQGCPPFALTAVLGTFLRKLPEPVFPFEVYKEVLALALLQNDNERLPLLKALIDEKLPAYNRYLLRELLFMLWLVQLNATVNKMHGQNLATAFGPNLIWSLDLPVAT
jgi:hypothetical protein